ncbi:MAG: response regulator [Verrucomicrobiota bacterium]
MSFTVLPTYESNSKPSLFGGSQSRLPLLRRLWFRLLVALIVFFALILSSVFYTMQSKGREVLEIQAEKLNSEIGLNIVLKLGERIAETEALTESMAKLAASLPKDVDTFMEVIPAVLDREGSGGTIAGGGVWPEPDAFEEGVERRSFFWGRNERGILEYYDDYNNPEDDGYLGREWYAPARYLKKGDVFWSKSYMDPYSYQPMVTCTVPIWEGKEFRGVATVDLKLEGLDAFLASHANEIGGYAFAVDRNNKLLSFPRPDLGKRFEVDEYGRRVEEYVEFSALGEIDGSFQEISRVLDSLNDRRLANVEMVAKAGLQKLAGMIDVDSDELNAQEARSAAAMILSDDDPSVEATQLSLDNDFLLRERVSLSVFSVPSTQWKVVIAMPARYAQASVDSLSKDVSRVLFVLVFLICVAIYLFFSKYLLNPIRSLTSQVQDLAEGEDSTALIKLEGRDELARLAYWFNARTEAMKSAFEALTQKNVDLEEATASAEEANRSKNVFLASMSHEIRTPMNAIIGMSALLQDSALGRDQIDYVRTIRSSSEALLSLINDIMDYSKIEANQIDLESIPFDLREVMNDIADLVSFQADEKGLELVCHLHPDVDGRLIGDPGRLRQVLLNLAGNAIKFTNSGEVEVWGTQIKDEGETAIVGFEVRDTGIGIPEEAHSRLFESFAQLDSSTTRRYGGTGLGLSISKRLTELMGGEISLESEVGVGSTFRFYVNLKKQSDLGSLDTRRGPEELVGKRVLILDDVPSHLRALQQQLDYWGLKCVGCSEREEALLLLAEGEEFDYAVVGLTDDRRTAFCERSRKFLAGMDARLLYHASLARIQEVETLEQEGFSAFLGKPLKRSQLESVMISLEAPSNDQVPGLSAAHKIERIQNGVKNVKVLVAEDNAINQKVAQQLLEKIGIDCDVARNGKTAINYLMSEDYDLILMDWQMPVMDGLEATRRIRAMGGKWADAPIIAMTANAMQGDRETCLKAGMDDYISKPITPDNLRELLFKWLGKNGSNGNTY